MYIIHGTGYSKVSKNFLKIPADDRAEVPSTHKSTSNAPIYTYVPYKGPIEAFEAKKLWCCKMPKISEEQGREMMIVQGVGWGC